MSTIVIPNFNTEKSMVGLNTYTYTVGSASLHKCQIQVDHRSASSLTVSITQSGSFSGTLATGTVQPQSSTSDNGRTGIFLVALANCQAGDVISFVLTSSASIDEQLNTTKATFKVSVGQN